MKGGPKQPKVSNRKSLGFTIVEVMIVLAVTGLLLYGAILLISGKQNETGFQLAINSVTTQIQQAINDVANGYYPNLSDFSCMGTPGNVNVSYGVPAGQGTNAGCIFLGKVMVFTNTTSNFNTYTLAAAQLQANGQQTTGFNFTSPSGYTLISLKDFVSQTLSDGLSVAWMHYLDLSNGTGNTATSAFMTNSQGAYSSSGALSSGSSQVNLYALIGTPISNTTPQIVNTFDNQPNSIVRAQNVQICFASGTTNQSGLVTIQNGSGKLQATLAIKAGTTC